MNPILQFFLEAGGPAAVGGLGWWLSNRFRASEELQRKALAAHEEKDMERHEQNLERFETISVELATLGSRRNGDARPRRTRA